MKKLSFIMFIVIAELMSMNAYGQLNNPIYGYDSDANPHFIGVYFGFGQNYQTGKILPLCPECEFENGNKFGFTAGLFYEYGLTEHFFIGSALEYNYLGINAYFREIEKVRLEIPVDGNTLLEEVNLTFQHEANLDIHNLSVIPYVKYQPFEFLFFKLGVGLGMNISNNFVHQKNIAQKTVKLSNGETALVNLNKNNIILESGDLRDATPFQIYLSPEIGFNIPFSKDVIFSPAFSYSKALMNISTTGADPQIHYWRVLLELKYKLDKEY